MPRLISASAFSFSHLPSCTTKLTNSLGQSTACEGKSETAAPSNCGLQAWTQQLTAPPPFWLPEWWQTISDYLETSQFPTTKTSSTIWRTSSEPWAFLRSSTSFENQSRLKQSKRKKLQTSSIIYSARKLGSRTFDKSDLTWNGSVSASLISPSSFGLFGMQVQHQTSTHAGNILSSYGNPCKLDPVQVYATCMCLPKRKGKWALPQKNLAKALDDYLAKGDSLEDPFSKQTLRNYQPCVSTLKTPEQHKECVNQQNTVYHKFCPILLSCNFGGTSH